MESLRGRPSFVGFFGRNWSLMPPDEARPVLIETLQWAREEKTEPHRFSLTNDPGDPELNSENELWLFGLMPALQALEPELAQNVLRNHPQVAAALGRFPRGMLSVMDEGREFDRARDDVIMIGHSRIMPVSEALATNFEAALREAYVLYARDSDSENPNEAPKECWPSASEFRNILFKAGQHQGLEAVQHLDRISDPDLRLFAQIELCAALEDLPQIGGTISYSSKQPSAGPEIPGVLNVSGGPARKTSGAANVAITGTHLILGDSARDAAISGKSRYVSIAEKYLHITIGTLGSKQSGPGIDAE
jgi:hypothetical protein